MGREPGIPPGAYQLAVTGVFKMLPIELAIFDLDGTLIDSQYDLTSATNYIRSIYNLPNISTDKVRSYIGDGIKVLIEKALPGVDEREFDIATIKFQAFYGENLLKTTRLYTGVAETLEQLGGIRKAILTNKPEALTKIIIKKLDIGRYFDSVSGGDSTLKRKPDPQPVLDIIKKLDKRRENTIIVGDGKNDILAARATGIKSVAVTYGYTDQSKLEQLEPDYIIDRISKLPKIILK
jgi:phosphoglycolate phosphatase